MATARGGADGALRPERELTLKAAAELTGISGKILSRYIREGRLEPASMDGNRLTVTIASLREAGLLPNAALEPQMASAPAPAPAAQAPASAPRPAPSSRQGAPMSPSPSSTLEKLERERLAREKAERERVERARADRERLERERIERESHERDRAAAERERVAAERERAANERAESERRAAERAKADQERIAAEKAKADRETADREKAERERAEKVERERAEKAKAEREKADRERVDRERAEKAKAEREKAERESAEREKAENERRAAERAKAEQERVAAEKAKAEREKDERERAEKAKAERDDAEREKAERKRSHVVTRPAPGRDRAPEPEVVDDLDAAEAEDLREVRIGPEDARDPEVIQPDSIEPEIMGGATGGDGSRKATTFPPSTGQLVSAGQIQDLLSRLLSEREARSQEWQSRAEGLYREMIDEQRARIATLEDEKRALDASLRDALQMVPKGVDLTSLEEQNRDLRIELDRRDAAKVALESDRDRLRDLVDRLKNELSRSEKRNLDLAETVRRIRARGFWDRVTGSETDER